jgi:hypothetical protein
VLPKDAKPFSPLYLVFNLPVAMTVELPLFEPDPACGYSNADVLYQVLGDIP